MPGQFDAMVDCWWRLGGKSLNWGGRESFYSRWWCSPEGRLTASNSYSESIRAISLHQGYHIISYLHWRGKVRRLELWGIFSGKWKRKSSFYFTYTLHANIVMEIKYQITHSCRCHLKSILVARFGFSLKCAVWKERLSIFRVFATLKILRRGNRQIRHACIEYLVIQLCPSIHLQAVIAILSRGLVMLRR